jgi:hypothetical protein
VYTAAVLEPEAVRFRGIRLAGVCPGTVLPSWLPFSVSRPSEKSDTACKIILDGLNRRVYIQYIQSAAVARGAKTEEGKMATKTRTVSRCECGRVKSQYANICNKCGAEKTAARNAEYRAILANGSCPKCGSALRRNLSISGWWQCEQLGAENFRARPSEPSCSFQMIIEQVA